MTEIKLIVGLGNPGSLYEHTRHNAGVWFAEALASHFKSSFKLEKKFDATVASFTHDNETYRIMLPTTFMNLSGQAVVKVAQFYKVKAHEILVAHDDLDLPSGRIRLKVGGGHGGHNGLRDIVVKLGTSDFSRIRIGIGHPGDKDHVLKYVLERPDDSSKESIMTAIQKSIHHFSLIVSDSALAMNVLHTET